LAADLALRQQARYGARSFPSMSFGGADLLSTSVNQASFALSPPVGLEAPLAQRVTLTVNQWGTTNLQLRPLDVITVRAAAPTAWDVAPTAVTAVVGADTALANSSSEGALAKHLCPRAVAGDQARFAKVHAIRVRGPGPVRKTVVTTVTTDGNPGSVVVDGSPRGVLKLVVSWTSLSSGPLSATFLFQLKSTTEFDFVYILGTKDGPFPAVLSVGPSASSPAGYPISGFFGLAGTYKAVTVAATYYSPGNLGFAEVVASTSTTALEDVLRLEVRGLSLADLFSVFGATVGSGQPEFSNAATPVSTDATTPGGSVIDPPPPPPAGDQTLTPFGAIFAPPPRTSGSAGARVTGSSESGFIGGEA